MDRRNMKYVALDVGNVLCTVDEDGFLSLLSEKLNITIQEARRFLRRFQQIHDLGYTTMEDELKDQFNVKSPIILDKLVTAWNDSIQPRLNMLEILNNLRDQHNLKVALLSNIGPEHAAKLETKLQLGGFFPGAVKHLSCFVGARKPSMVYYQSFLFQHPEFRGCIYVDDLHVNLEASKQFGFRTFHMSLAEQGVGAKIAELEQLLISDKILDTIENSHNG